MPASLAIILALATVAAIIVAIRWRRVLLMALPFLVTLNGVPLSVGRYSVRLDQAAACLLLFALVTGRVAGTRRIRLDGTSWLLLALLAINLASSVLNSPVQSYSVLQCLNLAATWSIYVVVTNELDDVRDVEEFLGYALWSALFACALGVAAFVLALGGLPVGGAEVSRSAAEHLTSAYGAYGTMIEPNILGSFSAGYLVLVSAMLLVHVDGGGSWISARRLRWTAAATGTALVITFTRAAWLGAIVGVACLAASSHVKVTARFGPRRIVLVLASAAALVGVLLVWPGNVGMLLRFKLTNLINPASQTAVVRLFTYVLAWEQTLRHPLIGTGTFSFAALSAQGADFQQFENWRHLWIGNYLLLALHDTGVVGLMLWVALIWTVVARALRVLRTTRHLGREAAGQLLGLLAAVVSMLVAFLSTSGFSLGYSWLIIGMLAASCRAFEAQHIGAALPAVSEPDDRGTR